MNATALEIPFGRGEIELVVGLLFVHARLLSIPRHKKAQDRA